MTDHDPDRTRPDAPRTDHDALPADPSELLATAIRAARAGAAALAEYAGGRAPLGIEQKGLHDFVTRADLASERAVLAVIREAHPGHLVLAEEESRAELTHPGPLWIVDPLDGTTNFIHGFPAYAVSVACAVGGRVVAGAVLDPCRDELFGAVRGGGATRNGAPIRVSGRAGLQDALVGTGFPFRQHARIDAYLQSLRAVIADTAGIRRAGSAALDLCSVACGRFDGFWEEGLGPWDMAAGALLIEEAGGTVTDMRGGDRWLETGSIVAGTPGVYPALYGLVAAHL